MEEVTPPLSAAGHKVHPLTLPGLESADAPRAGIGLRTHIDAVVAKIDSFDAPVVLVGHSGGGAIIHGAVDARPDRVARAIYVDSGPLGEGGVINDELPEEDGEVPLPPWELFDDEDLVDLTMGSAPCSVPARSRSRRAWPRTASSSRMSAASRSRPPSSPVSSRRRC